MLEVFEFVKDASLLMMLGVWLGICLNCVSHILEKAEVGPADRGDG